MNFSSNNKPNAGFSAIGAIEHVIVLMFENRSFDHLLGAMPGVDGVLDSQGNVLPNLYNTMDPIAEPGADNPPTPPTPIVPFLNPEPPLPTEDQLITHDFTHEFGDGLMLTFPEPKEFALGLSMGHPEGSGTGKEFAGRMAEALNILHSNSIPTVNYVEAFALFFHSLSWELVAAVALADVGIAAIGTLLAAIAAASRARELLLPLLFLPLAIPVVIGGVGASIASDPGSFLGFLVLYDGVFAILCWASFEYVVTE